MPEMNTTDTLRDRINLIGRGLTLLFWGIVIVNLISPFHFPANKYWNQIGLFIFAAHILQAYIYNARLKEYGDDPVKDTSMILVFGLLRLRPIIRKKRAALAEKN